MTRTTSVMFAVALAAMFATGPAHADPWKSASGISCQNGSPKDGGLRSARVIELTKPMKVYRLWGGSASKLGGFWTDTRYSKSKSTRAALGICEAWPDGSESPMDHSVSCTAPAGTKMCRGTTQSVKCGDGTIYKSTGNYQYFIPGSERSKLKC
jgi:hypothetical protein